MRSSRVLLLTAALYLLAACGEHGSPPLQGYAEGEYVLMASPWAGTLRSLVVARGQQVAGGDALFTLERLIERAATDETQARVRAAEAQLANLREARRPAEIEALRQQGAAARAALALSAENLRQQQRLHASGFVSAAVLDQARATRDRDAAQLAAAQATVRNASQGIGRGQELAAARAELDAARAADAQARTRYADKALSAPTDSLVADTYFRVGEWVPAGAPVVSLLPPGNIKLRFFVPEALVGSLRSGQSVSVSCDGCGTPIPAHISYVSPQAEYTPPVIYSRDARTRLVFLVEARPAPADAVRLHPGQPVDVTLAAP